MDSGTFAPIRVSTLRGDQPVPFDVYVKIGAKYILYSRMGESFDTDRLNRLKEKKVKILYIHSGDQSAYRSYLAFNVSIAYSNKPEKPIEVRAAIAQGIQQASLEQLIMAPDNRAQFDVLSSDTRRYIDFVISENKALRALLNIDNSTGTITHHCVNVATVAIGLAHQLGYRDAQKLEDLALGCLLHDIEHTHNGLNVARPLEQLSPAEMTIYKRHPIDGLAKIRGSSFYSPVIKAIIEEHHETCDGSGFPSHKKTEQQLNPMTLIASVADQYDRLISFEREDKAGAIRKLLINRVGLHPLGHIQALADYLKKQL